MSTQTFHHFQHLPAELRLQIWNEALPAPRLLGYILLTWNWDRTKPFQPIPPMLHVNHEARTVALKHYAWYKYSGTLNIKRHVCFSSKRDILSLPKYYPQLSSEPHVTKIGSSSEEPVYLEHEFRTVWISDTSYWEWLKHPESKRRGLSVYCRRLKGLENYVVIKGATAVSICSDPLVIMKQETEYFETGRDGDVRKVALHLWTLIPDTPEVSSEEEDSEVDEAAEAA